jgi:hypothetical protein
MGRIDAYTLKVLGESLIMKPEEMCRMDSISARPENMDLTFYTRYGDAVFAMPCGLLALAGFVLVLAVERRKNRGVNSNI